jgi:hypothetical protein
VQTKSVSTSFPKGALLRGQTTFALAKHAETIQRLSLSSLSPSLSLSLSLSFLAPLSLVLSLARARAVSLSRIHHLYSGIHHPTIHTPQRFRLAFIQTQNNNPLLRLSLPFQPEANRIVKVHERRDRQKSWKERGVSFSLPLSLARYSATQKRIELLRCCTDVSGDM